MFIVGDYLVALKESTHNDENKTIDKNKTFPKHVLSMKEVERNERVSMSFSLFFHLSFLASWFFFITVKCKKLSKTVQCVTSA